MRLFKIDSDPKNITILFTHVATLALCRLPAPGPAAGPTAGPATGCPPAAGCPTAGWPTAGGPPGAGPPPAPTTAKS